MKLEIYSLGNHEPIEAEVQFHYHHLFSGYGHWKIICIAEYEGEQKEFRHITTDSMFIDEVVNAKQDESYEVTQKMYHDSFYSDFEERIGEWIDSLVD